MDPRNDTWIPLFRHIVVNQRPAERLSRISRFVACSDDGGAIAMQLLEEALRMVREKAPTAEWLSQMVHFKDSNPLIYAVPLKIVVRTPVDFAVVSSAIDVGFYIRELMVDADVDTGIYDQIRRKWMENKEKDCFDDLVNLEQAGTMLEGDFLH